MDNNWNKLIHHDKHILRFDKYNIIVNDEVFTPDPTITYSSSIIIDNFPDVKNKIIADVGSGTGILSIHAAISGARKVIATDISNQAIENTCENIRVNNLGKVIEVSNTDLLESIDEKFDFVFANLPLLEDMWNLDIQSIIERFLSSLSDNTKENTSVYIPWASFSSISISDLENLFKKYGWNFKVITQEKLNHTWYLYVLEK